VRATDVASGAPIGGLAIDAEPEGMTLSTTTATTDARGWAAFTAQPIGHVLQMSLHTKSGDRTGDWIGALAVAPGGSGLSVPARLQPNALHTFEVVAPTQRAHAYLEVHDDTGRAWATAPALELDATSTPRATFDLPKLAAGLYWIAVSGDPQGAETAGAATTYEPFFVAEDDAAALKLGLSADACAASGAETKRAIGPCLATAAAGPFPRWTALEGFASVRAHEAKNRSRGMTLAVGSIVVAAALETLLILVGVSESRRRLRAAQTDADEDVAMATPRTTAMRVAVGLLVALLGFALVLALVLRAA
jgi:hypothetical protein